MADNTNAELELASSSNPNSQLERATSSDLSSWSPWWFDRAILEAVERLMVDDNNNAARGWTWQQIRDSVMPTIIAQDTVTEEELAQDTIEEMLLQDLDWFLRTGDLKVVGVGGDGDEHYYTLPLSSPPDLPEALMANNNTNAELEQIGPHAILKTLEWLVVKDKNNAAQGWTWQHIRDSLMQTHHRHQELPQDLFDNTLRRELDELLEMGDLKVVGVGGDGDDHYMLSPPYLPEWFCPEAVLQAVRELDNDNGNAGGSTWEEIRDSLKRTHQPEPEQPLPPDFDAVLRTMLSVVHKWGHLTVTRGSNGGPRLYTRRQAPAPDHIDIPGYVWWYFLGYKLSAGGVLDDDSDSDFGEQILIDEEEVALLMANAPPWFGPRTVLQEIKHQSLNSSSSIHTLEGWTSQDIRDCLMKKRHELPQAGFDLDRALQATLATLSNGGYLKPVKQSIEPRYKLSIIPPRFPSWFGPEAVLEAVLELDNKNDGGSTGPDVKGYLMTRNSGTDWPLSWLPLDPVLLAMLSVLRQRGHLTWGAGGPGHYTRRGATAATIDILDYYLIWYYVGYKRKRVSNYSNYAAVTDLRNVNVFRQRRPAGNRSANNPAANDDTEIHPLPRDAGHEGEVVNGDERTTDEARRKEKSRGARYKGLFSWWPGAKQFFMGLIKKSPNGAPKDIESQAAPRNDEQPRTQGEMDVGQQRKQQRKWYMIWRVCLSLIGHGILFGVSFIPGFGEGKTNIKWLLWAAMNIIVPLVLLILMIIIQIYLDLGLEEDTTSQETLEDKKREKIRNKMINLVVLAGSKFFYLAIKEAPGGPKDILRITAHVVAFLIDMGGALYLWKKHSGLDQEMPEIALKDD